MNDAAVRAAYARFLAEREPAGRAGCPAPDALLALAERRGPESERLATLDHTMACAACRRDLDLLRAIVTAGGQARVRRIEPRWLAAAAVVVLTLGGGWLWLRPEHEPVPNFRSGEAVQLVAPLGSSAPDSIVFVWRPVPHAVRYRVDVLTTAGDSVMGMATLDTIAPERLGALQAGRSYIWTVRAFFADGSYAVSGPARLTVIQR